MICVIGPYIWPTFLEICVRRVDWPVFIMSKTSLRNVEKARPSARQFDIENLRKLSDQSELQNFRNPEIGIQESRFRRAVDDPNTLLLFFSLAHTKTKFRNPAAGLQTCKPRLSSLFRTLQNSKIDVQRNWHRSSGPMNLDTPLLLSWRTELMHLNVQNRLSCIWKFQRFVLWPFLRRKNHWFLGHFLYFELLVLRNPI